MQTQLHELSPWQTALDSVHYPPAYLSLLDLPLCLHHIEGINYILNIRNTRMSKRRTRHIHQYHSEIPSFFEPGSFSENADLCLVWYNPNVITKFAVWLKIYHASHMLIIGDIITVVHLLATFYTAIKIFVNE